MIYDICTDEAFYYAINPPTIASVNDMCDMDGKYIFDYNKNPNTITDTIAFITIKVSTFKFGSGNSVYVRPKVDVYIYCHNNWMNVDNIPKIKANRLDYISQLIDAKFNGITSFNSIEPVVNLLGGLELVENSEDTFSDTFQSRHMIFITKDLNSSLCQG
jgi:hypothetical protein